jgi:hypothetical protein
MVAEGRRENPHKYLLYKPSLPNLQVTKPKPKPIPSKELVLMPS